jgi:hypothetical protein
MFIPKKVSNSQNVSELPQRDARYEYGVSNVLSLTHSVTHKQN